MNARVLLFAGIGLLGVAVVATLAVLLSQSPTQGAAMAIEPTSAPGRLSGQLPPGQLAMVVRPDPVPGPAVPIGVGDRVDLLAYFSAELTGGGQAITRILAWDVPVLSGNSDGREQSVTLAMTPDQALLLQQASQLGGRLFVVLRASRGPDGPVGPETITDQDVATRLSRVFTDSETGGSR